jgi:circadian clock protein KaiC
VTSIEKFSTGVPGLDRILGGGLPYLSFNIVAGDPGGGKTTLAHQLVFANATEERPALYVTVVGEPPVKMLRYQQRFPFFDPDRVGRAVHYRNLSTEAMAGDLGVVLERIRRFVEELEPALVVVDSFRSVVRLTRPTERNVAEVQTFVQRLATDLARWEATTFLVGEFRQEEAPVNPVFTVADGLFWLQQHREGDSRVRKLEVSKLRGGAELPGRHIYRISEEGIRVYPRHIPELEAREGVEGTPARVSLGVPELDELMGGGARRGDAVVVSGPSGCGKSILATQFLAEGVKRGETCVVALFEEGHERYLERSDEMGLDLREAEGDGRLRVLVWEALDLSVDDTFEEIRDAAEELGASRLVIDSLSGLQVIAAGSGAKRMRQAISRVVRALAAGGVTVLLTAELNQHLDELRFTAYESSFLADDIILMRYVELRGELQTALSVVKMRRSDHSQAFHRYGVTASGIVVGEPLANLRGILTGVPDIGGDQTPRDAEDWERIEGDDTPQEPEDAGDATAPQETGGDPRAGKPGSEGREAE